MIKSTNFVHGLFKKYKNKFFRSQVLSRIIGLININYKTLNMKCPNCNVALVMADRNGVEIDYCPECRGVWLDRGELDKIIERSAQSVTMAQPNKEQSQQYYSKESEYKHKKKKGFLGDLFDF
jgi:Zn-finger nucleic acid-binding protein